MKFKATQPGTGIKDLRGVNTKPKMKQPMRLGKMGADSARKEIIRPHNYPDGQPCTVGIPADNVHYGDAGGDYKNGPRGRI